MESAAGRTSVFVSVLAALAVCGVSATASAHAPAVTGKVVAPTLSRERAGRRHRASCRRPVTSPVPDRALAERGVRITPSTAVPGQFSWIDDRTVQWTPAHFWPAQHR